MSRYPWSEKETFSDIDVCRHAIVRFVNGLVQQVDLGLQRWREQAGVYVEAALAASTRRAYNADWRHFESWCRSHGCIALPAGEDTLVLYLTDFAATHRPASLDRKLSVIRRVHEAADMKAASQSLRIRLLVRGIRRSKGTREEGKRPIRVAELAAMVAGLPLRDQALLLVGFAGALRRSELVGLNWEDVTWLIEGMQLLLRRSKTDQEGQGREVAIPYAIGESRCPVKSLAAWRAACGFPEKGPIFGPKKRLNDRTVARVVQKAVQRIGLDARLYGGHSLRSGFATEAARGGASERSIMRQTGHRSAATLWRYIRYASLFEEHALAKTGL